MAQVVVKIDAQNGFAASDGGLFVPGSDMAMDTFGAGIKRAVEQIDEQVDSYDWHPRNHFFSAGSGRIADAAGNPVPGYTFMSREQVFDGEFRATSEVDQPWLIEYVDHLAERDKKDLAVWPEHCVAGTWDADQYHAIVDANAAWEQFHQRRVLRHYKGTDPDREQYGAWGDEVPNRAGLISFETKLVKYINSFDRKLWGGLVLSHCLMASFEQAMTLESSDRYKTHVILRDCTTVVPGFEDVTEAWLQSWQDKGVQVMNIAEALPV